MSWLLTIGQQSVSSSACQNGECSDQTNDTLTVPVLVKVAVLMPITRAEESNKGPPEFPALMAASVCTAPSPSSDGLQHSRRSLQDRLNQLC